MNHIHRRNRRLNRLSTPVQMNSSLQPPTLRNIQLQIYIPTSMSIHACINVPRHVSMQVLAYRDWIERCLDCELHGHNSEVLLASSVHVGRPLHANVELPLGPCAPHQPPLRPFEHGICTKTRVGHARVHNRASMYREHVTAAFV